MLRPVSLYMLLSFSNLYAHFVVAKNLGVHGPLFPIEERNLLEVIQEKLLKLEKTGKIKEINKQIIETVRKKAERPTPTILPTCVEYAARPFDPTFAVQKTIKDHQGNVIALAGTRINPLDTFKWGEPLLLLDGDNEEQIALAKRLKAKWVLTKGNPFALMKKHKRRIYFDQGGKIVEHFGITAVPSLISQQDKALLIEEFPTNHTPGEHKNG